MVQVLTAGGSFCVCVAPRQIPNQASIPHRQRHQTFFSRDLWNILVAVTVTTVDFGLCGVSFGCISVLGYIQDSKQFIAKAGLYTEQHILCSFAPSGCGGLGVLWMYVLERIRMLLGEPSHDKGGKILKCYFMTLLRDCLLGISGY